jgi:hypothetical protein
LVPLFEPGSKDFAGRNIQGKKGGRERCRRRRVRIYISRGNQRRRREGEDGVGQTKKNVKMKRRVEKRRRYIRGRRKN